MPPDDDALTAALQEQEEKKEAAKQATRAAVAELFKTGAKMTAMGAGVLALLVLLAVAGSAWAFWRADTSMICLMGLVWVIGCLMAYLLLQEFAGVGENLDPLFRGFAEFNQTWEDEWSQWFGLRKLMTEKRLRGLGDALTYVEGASEEIAEWSEKFGQPILKLSRWLMKQLYRWCFVAMGLASFVARQAADLHLGKANAEIQKLYVVFGQLVNERKVETVISAAIVALGFALDLRRNLATRWGENRVTPPKKDGKTVIPSRRAEKSLLFLMSFEMIRVLILLGCGLKGQTSLDAAQTIFEVPSKDQVGGISVLVPVLALSEERRLAAYQLFEQFGPETYWTLFALVPAVLVGYRFARKLWGATFGSPVSPNENWSAAVLLSLWILLLSTTVAYSSGDLEKRAKEIYAATLAEPPEKAVIECEAKARAAAGPDLPQRLGACLTALAADWETETRRAITGLREVSTAGERQKWERTQAEWEKNLAAAIRRSPNDAVELRVRNWRQRAMDMSRYENELRSKRTQGK